MGRRVRIGIDVGGTFTDAIVLDNQTFEVIAKMKRLTTHNHPNGVAQGIVELIQSLLKENKIEPEDVVFIAHGTTQATNALLEADVAKVGILGMSTGMDALSAKKETNIGDIELSNSKYLKVFHTFLDSKDLTDESIVQNIEKLLKDSAEVIVASESYSVDDPTNEKKVIQISNGQNIYATGGYEVSELYGLRVRTRTAVVNASLIPKMVETADMTERAVKSAGINSELMIMRCDGGVMSVKEMRSRPILTMLSGLAAGVAGALMYEKISDGIFFEIGGTSVDISVIKNGKVALKTAQIGGHRTYVRSLDVRTLGLAGGSMIQVADKKIIDVGPRSAHIADKEYECFCDAGQLENMRLEFMSPRKGDPNTYAVIEGESPSLALTLAGAANILGYIPEEDYACGDVQTAKKAWKLLADYLGESIEDCCKTVMDLAIDKLMVVINDLIAEYELDQNFVTLVGGGGSASVLVPATAKREGFKYVIAENAPYISTIGVALAMVKEQVERTVSNPDEDDIARIRNDAIEKIVRSGANEETVDVVIEIDAQKNILRAVATGSTELRTKSMGATQASMEQMHEIAAQALSADPEATLLSAQSGRWYVFEHPYVNKTFFGLIKKKRCDIAVLDREGVVRHRGGNEHYLKFQKKHVDSSFVGFVEEYTIYSDANATIPKVFLFYGEKVLDLCAMQSMNQLMSLIDLETKFLDENQEMIAVAYQ